MVWWLAESAGGFGSFLLGMNKKTYELSGPSTPGNVAASIKEPGIGWMTGFLLSVSFVGLLTLLPLRKVQHSCGPLCLSDSLIFPYAIHGFCIFLGFCNCQDSSTDFLFVTRFKDRSEHLPLLTMIKLQLFAVPGGNHGSFLWFSPFSD